LREDLLGAWGCFFFFHSAKRLCMKREIKNVSRLTTGYQQSAANIRARSVISETRHGLGFLKIKQGNFKNRHKNKIYKKPRREEASYKLQKNLCLFTRCLFYEILGPFVARSSKTPQRKWFFGLRFCQKHRHGRVGPPPPPFS
jgi:hypothetical protein